ncbi:MAG: hypothetical protein EHM47_08960 [Ignavibacteriales bacterium]|nr:MAG: hypothetical protein EHM47_08960 [Ignavibacteriales bacterium]
MQTIYKLLAISLLITFTGIAQSFSVEDSVEVYVIDSFIPPDNPNVFNLSFFTSEPAKSKVVFNDEHEYEISKELSEEHRIQIDLIEAGFKTKTVSYIIFVEDSSGQINQSEKLELELQEEIQMEGESNFLLLCLFGGTVFLLPNPVLVITEDENYFSLTKEIALLTFRGSYNYPAGYIAAEYSHIFGAPKKNFLRIGYKHIMEIPGIEYLSPGLNGFTNFNGFNGISPELSVGLFKIYRTFTVYTRYRYNFKPGETGSQFHEISLGLYSSFFSFYF